MSKFTSKQNEQYFRVRLDPYKLRHSRGMEFRAMCPFHGGSNPTQLWVNLAEGNYCCFSCPAKGGSAFAFEQALLRVEGGKSQAPNCDEVTRSLEQVLGTPFSERTYNEPIPTGRQRGWNRSQARDFYRYTDELGNELFTVWRFIDRHGNKYLPVDRPCPCQPKVDSVCTNDCDQGRIWNRKGVHPVLYRLPDVIQSLVIFVVEGEKNANDLSRALAGYIAEKKGFDLNGCLTLERIAVTTNPGGAAQWKRQYGFGRYFWQKVVIKLSDNDAPGRLHTEAACSEIADYTSHLFTLDLPVGEGEDISDYLEKNSIVDFLKLLPQRKEWKAGDSSSTCLDGLDSIAQHASASEMGGGTRS
jgi:CHC2 zinc finger